eukprot:CAMPEP_0173185800 /NCGR_PEP_ID=MMETSP1141-20130122/9765_1 /TAXON_ID=483371 /ORGANISM="non described non described, Strain CCMP2298" /LENGTH=153 /DNA_ID=CAMNT_0014109387 /DNA_START=139 /DNA_END=601 /DNA_ORIENTATION=-
MWQGDDALWEVYYYGAEVAEAGPGCVCACACPRACPCTCLRPDPNAGAGTGTCISGGRCRGMSRGSPKASNITPRISSNRLSICCSLPYWASQESPSCKAWERKLSERMWPLDAATERCAMQRGMSLGPPSPSLCIIAKLKCPSAEPLNAAFR